MEPAPGVVGMGTRFPDFWLAQSDAPTAAHVALRADSREAVDAFHAAALAAGGSDNGPPGLRPHYHPGYYGAFVSTPTATTSRPSTTRSQPGRPAHALRSRRRRSQGPAVCGRYGPLPRSAALVFVPAAPCEWRTIHFSTW